MKKNKDQRTEQRTELNENLRDTREFIDMYVTLRPEDKLKVQGIMIGLQMNDQLKGVATA